MFYTFNSSEGFDRNTAARHATLADAGAEILAYDQRASGVDLIDGEYVPWQQPHRGDRKLLSRLAAETEQAAYESVASADGFDIKCVSEQRAAQIEADCNAA